MQSLAEWTLEASLSPNSWVHSAPSVPHCLLLSGLICLWKSRTCVAMEPFPEQKPQAVDSLTNGGNLHCANPRATHDPNTWACVREPRRGCAQRKEVWEATIHLLIRFGVLPRKWGTHSNVIPYSWGRTKTWFLLSPSAERLSLSQLNFYKQRTLTQ